MPQPDSGNTCCDCPSRTSPCDDCQVIPLPCTFVPTSITLAGISVNCSCIETFPGSGTYFSTSTSLSCPPPGTLFGQCCGPPIVGADGIYALIPGSAFGPDFEGAIAQCIANSIFWNDSSCDPGSPPVYVLQPFTNTNIYVGCATSPDLLYSGMPTGWWIYVDGLFYADGISNPTVPTANTANCNATPFSFVNWGATGGTAAIT